MNFYLNDRAVEFELDNTDLTFHISDLKIDFTLNTIIDTTGNNTGDNFRLLEDGFIRRLTESGDFRILE